MIVKKRRSNKLTLYNNKVDSTTIESVNLHVHALSLCMHLVPKVLNELCAGWFTAQLVAALLLLLSSSMQEVFSGWCEGLLYISI